MSKAINEVNNELCKGLGWRTPVNKSHVATIDELSQACKEAFPLYAEPLKEFLLVKEPENNG